MSMYCTRRTVRVPLTAIIAALLDDVNVMDVLEKGLDDLAGACDVVLGKFRQARDELPRQTER